MPAELSDWLRNSIAGIVLLGAIGSLLAVVTARFLMALRDGFFRAPYQAHKRRKMRQVYFLGGAAANIQNDETGRMLTAYVAFHLCRLAIALVAFLFSAILAINVLGFQGQVVLTVGLFVSIAIAFLSLYWAYFEFEYIYRTYLFLWKRALKNSEEAYKKYLQEKTNGSVAPTEPAASSES